MRMSETILPLYKKYQLETLSQRPKLKDYAVPEFAPSVEVEMDKSKFVKELRKYFNTASAYLKHLRCCADMRHQFYMRYHVNDEDSGHQYARVKFIELVTEGEQRVRFWEAKLRDLESEERQASFLQNTRLTRPSVGAHALLYQASDVGSKKTKKKLLKKQKANKGPRKHSAKSGFADTIALNEGLKNADNIRTAQQERTPTKIIDAAMFWDALAEQARIACVVSDENSLRIFGEVSKGASAEFPNSDYVNKSLDKPWLCDENKEKFMEAAVSYADLVLSEFITRPEKSFLYELNALYFLSTEFLAFVLSMILEDITSEDWSELDIFMFISNKIFHQLLGSISFEELDRILHKTLNLSQNHSVVLLTKSLWRSCRALVCQMDLQTFVNLIKKVSGDAVMIVKALKEDPCMTELLKNGLPFPILNGKVKKDYMKLLSDPEKMFEESLSQVRSILKSKQISLEKI